jgi:2-polyprenyl-6-methoxyphenol hydroxylase-like FAD-dependent oxidoreductase
VNAGPGGLPAQDDQDLPAQDDEDPPAPDDEGPPAPDDQGPPSGPWDVVVVGARLAGATIAHALAPYAGRILLVDRSRPETFWPQQVTWDRPDNLIWADLGLTGTVLACGAPKLRGHTRRTVDVSVDYSYPDDDEHCYRMSVAREVLDPALAARAARWPNVRLLRPARVTAPLTDGERVTGVRLSWQGRELDVPATLVVFADGRVSPNAQRLGARAYRNVASPWTALLSYYTELGLPPDRVWYSRQAGSMLIVTPTGPDQWCVATAMHRDLIAERGMPPARLYRQVAGADPVIGAALALGTPVTRIGGAGRLRMYRRPMTGPGWCLVGDSGFHLDPMSALGTRAVLTTVRLLRDRVARLGRISAAPEDYADLGDLRDAALARDWDFTRQVIGVYRPGPEAVARARRLAADPEAIRELVRTQMGLTGPPVPGGSGEVERRAS